MQTTMFEEYRDGHKTHPVPEAWLQDHPCPAGVTTGCKRCWIDYCAAISDEEIYQVVEHAA